jgi:small-conductance mechanosensitive channel
LSLGSTAAISNIVAGVALTYMRPFNLGDRVKIADTMGDVVEKTLLITRVRTIKNVEVTIPNSMVLGSHMINLSALAKESGLILYTAITIGYDAPWRTVHELLMAAARATRDILAEPPPFVLQLSLNDFSITYELNAYTANVKELLHIQSELHQNIQDRFNEAGVEIMSPTFSAIRDGNQVTIPEDYLPKTAPVKGFRILPMDFLKPGTKT